MNPEVEWSNLRKLSLDFFWFVNLRWFTRSRVDNVDSCLDSDAVTLAVTSWRGCFIARTGVANETPNTRWEKSSAIVLFYSWGYLYGGPIRSLYFRELDMTGISHSHDLRILGAVCFHSPVRIWVQ